MSSDNSPDCPSAGGANDLFGLRVASLFIILIGSSFGALFPVLAHRSSWLHVPKKIFDFAKYFGSGVIIATAFIHLLSPALDELGSPCLSSAWSEYPYALALCLLSIFLIFIVELIAFRWGTAKLAKLGLRHDTHGHNSGSHAAHGPEGDHSPEKGKGYDISTGDNPVAQVIGIAILEFGVLLHSVLIGLTLAVNEDFKVLFVVVVFHQMFEGLGIGSRLAYMQLPSQYNWIPIAGGMLYGISTPIGIAVGLGIRTTYNPESHTALIVSGILDSLSAGILLYTGLVELLAHEFLFNREMIDGSNGKVAYALSSMLIGCGLMALLGKWA